MSNQVKIIALLVGAGVQFGLLIVNLLITSKMVIDERGVYAIVIAVIMIVPTLCTFGFTNALIKRMHSETLTIDYVVNVTVLILFQIIISEVIVFIILFSFPVITPDDITNMAMFLFPIVIFLVLRSYGQAFLLGVGRFDLFQTSKILPVIILASVLVVRDNYTLIDILYAWLVSEGILVAFLILCAFSIYKLQPSETPNGFRSDCKFGMKSLFGNTAFIEGYKMDLLILGYILPVAELAIYAVSKSIATVLRFIPQSLSQIAYPAIIRATDQDKEKTTYRFIIIAILSGFILMICAYFGYDNFVIGYIGEEYAESNILVFIMLLGLMAYSPRRIMYEYFKATNKPLISSKIEVVSFVIYFLILFFCISIGVTELIALAIMILLTNVIALMLSFKFSK